jgi:hypothetical protein
MRAKLRKVSIAPRFQQNFIGKELKKSVARRLALVQILISGQLQPGNQNLNKR